MDVCLQQQRPFVTDVRNGNKVPISNLRTSGKILRAAWALCNLAGEVPGPMRDRQDGNADTLQACANWALQEADALDLILSGQVLTHLRPPDLPTSKG